ncbi:MAG TPA: hypothetical protein VGG04_16505 [Candidatus Sulfotelmatobacter sp.]
MIKPLIPIVIALLCLSACHRNQTAAGPGKRYHFTGRVISIDPHSESAFIYGDDIPGFMDSMGMSYKIKPASTLDKLTPGDLISAEIVVMEPNPKDENAESDYWLENVKVTGHVKATAKPTMWRGHSCPRLALTAHARATALGKEAPRGTAALDRPAGEAPLAFLPPTPRNHAREGDTIPWVLGRV